MDETRSRIINATNELFRRTGYHGTSMSDVSLAAEATTGSIYHFFPGGKAELARAVMAESGAAYAALFAMIADAAPDAGSAIADFFDGAAEVLAATDYIDPCPVGTVAREVASTDDAIRHTAADVFDAWVGAAAARFSAEGMPDEAATELATSVVAALEGGFVLARTHRDADRLRTIGRRITELVRAELSRTPAR